MATKAKKKTTAQVCAAKLKAAAERAARRARVRAGMTLLDVRAPGWRDRVNLAELERFDMSSHQHCALGEVYGLYGTGVQMLNIGGETLSEALGFFESEHKNYSALTREWRRQYALGQARARREGRVR